MQAEETTMLPQPDDDARAHSERCAAGIRQHIVDNGGSISFGHFMHLALYADGLGYYSSGNTKFGAAGDFVTAPEISPIFARLLARQCAEVLAELDSASLLEYGAGSGRLAAQILLKLEAIGSLPENYLILEVSSELVARQKALLQENIPSLIERVQWISKPPRDFCGVVIANEVLDALPVERFSRREEILQHRVVADGERFVIVEERASDRLVEAVLGIEKDLGQRLPEGYVSDVSLATEGWLHDALSTMSHGIAFVVDYGVSRREYYAADRSGGWLRCHFRHRAHNNPLILPGVQDITAWVDFTAAASSAVRAGADIAGYVNQAMFLIAAGLEQEVESMKSMSDAERIELSAAVKMLTLPGSMGEHFKILGLRKGPVAIPTAFQLADRTHTL